MKVIQLVLLAMVVGGTAFYFSRMRSRLVDRLFVFTIALVAVAMVSAPKILEWLAATLEVGRGVDVVIYLLLIFLSFVWIWLYARLREQQAQLVELTRAMAIVRAKFPGHATNREPRILPMPGVLREVS
jgi:hypothetical protein